MASADMLTDMTTHELTYVRDIHTHVRAGCSCGWTGLWFTDYADVKGDHDAHLAGMTNRRIQRRRTRGWRMPAGTVYVGRGSKYGNKYRVGDPGVPDAATAVVLYENDVWVLGIEPEIQADLRGRDLACWCPLDQPCHADVLLRVANRQPEGAR
jgi:hypothetical protein